MTGNLGGAVVENTGIPGGPKPPVKLAVFPNGVKPRENDLFQAA